MMKKVLACILALALFVPLLAACGKSVEPDPAAAGYVEKPAGKVEGAGLKTLDEKLLDYIAERQSGNFVFSPLSFKYAYGLMLAGAEGKTLTELLAAFGIKDRSELENELAAVSAFAEKFDGSTGYHYGSVSSEEAEKALFSMSIANSVWMREGSDGVKDGYKDKIKNYKAEYCEFTSGNVVKKANDWVNEKTNGMIPRILPDGTDGDAVAMMLINALYFKDAWEEEFKTSDTKKGDFTTADGKTVKKDFMQKTDLVRYYSDDDTRLIIIPLQNKAAVAFVLGSTEDVSKKIANAHDCNVDIAIPKFEAETSLEHNELGDFLKACGVSAAFGEAADFSGMTDGRVYVSEIIQRAKLCVDESGVEGAAATDVIYLSGMSGEPVEFRADRPFSFFVLGDSGDIYKEWFVIFAGKTVE